MQNYLPKVREQYEALPYPPYNPADDKIQLVVTSYDRLDYLNHRFFDGRQKFGKGFRVLCAGDGTGHGSIFLAEQLSALGGEVVALDLSTASQAIAKERAALRKLTNITHIHASLLDLPKLGLGEFDYITCSGVLHHLADPDEGLRTLAGALKPDGVMGIMVYATVGRTAVYQMQEMLRRLFGTTTSMEQQLDITRTLLADLPRTNWFWFNNAPFMNDITKFGDSGIFDLLLHTQDRAYSAEQCHEWARRCGLKFAEFCPSNSHEEVTYNPCTYIQDAAFGERVKQLPRIEQHAIAELLAGNICMHNFYVTRQTPVAELSAEDHSLIPAWGAISPITPPDVAGAAQAVRAAIGKKTALLSIASCPVRVRLTPNEATAELMLAIDGTRTTAELLDHVSAIHSAMPRAAIESQWRTLYSELRLQLGVVLRRAEGARFLTILQMQQRSFARMDA